MTTDEPMQCERCGLPHTGQKKTTAPGCRGHRRDGAPCGNDAMRGQRVCRMHGGSTPGAREAGERRQAEAKANEEIRALWPGLATVEPVRDPFDLLARTAAALEHMAEATGTRVNELQGRVATGESLSQLRGEVVLLDKLLDKLLRAGDRMASLGIASRAVEVQQGQADLMLAWLRTALEAGQAAGGDHVVLDAVLAGFLEAMRRSRAGGVVAGELEGAAS